MPTEQYDIPWGNDVFKRKPYADFLTTLLCSKREPFTLNINAGWGTGKTFFITNWQQQIYNTHPTVYFNAWKKDFIDTPLPALISEINSQLELLSPKDASTKKPYKEFTKKTKKVLATAAPLLVKAIAKKYIGQEGVNDLITATSEGEESIANLAEAVTKSILEPFEKEEKSLKDFKEKLSDLLKYLVDNTSLELPLFIFIDELDRCRPLFAIETLEKVKHLFDIPEIMFVIATDTDQLSHSVKAIYGEGFDARLYLKRFFSQEFTLPDPNYVEFAQNLFRDFEPMCQLLDYSIANIGGSRKSFPEGPDTEYIGCSEDIKNRESILLFALHSEGFKLDLRTQKQCYDRLSAIIQTVPPHETLHLGYLIFLIAFKEKYPYVYNKFFINPGNRTRQDTENITLPNSKTYISIIKSFFGDSKTDLFNSKKLGFTYLHSIFQEKDSLIKGDPESSILNWLNREIYEQYENLRKYKERVDLAGQLR